MSKIKKAPRRAAATQGPAPSRTEDWRKTKALLIEELQQLRQKANHEAPPADGRLSLSTYQKIIDVARDAFWMTNLQGIMVGANRAACEMLGYSSEELIGMHLDKIDALESTSETEAHIRKIMDTGSDIFETRHRRKDGKVLDVEVATNYLADNDSEGLLFSIVRDITERKRIEQELEHYRERLEVLVQQRTRELRQSEERFSRAVSGAPIIFFTLDTEGLIRLSEGKGLERLNLRPGEIVGQSVYDIYRETPKLCEDIRSCLLGVELRSIVHLNGLWLETLLSPMKNEDGTITGVVGVSNDITTRILAEQQSALYLQELNQRNEALAQALHQAMTADKLKDEFMANVSHELRTPMSGVIGITELLLDTDLTEDQREQLRLVHSSADSLLTVINDLLDFSKIAADKLQLHDEPFSLRRIFGDTIDFFVVSAREKGVSLLFNVSPEVPDRLVGDHVRLRQVLVNLIGNAIKFTREGSICVEVHLEHAAEKEQKTAPPQKASLHFLVKDTGIGIAPEHQERIFDAFAQADGSTTRTFGGTGLGLAISSKIAALMGGALNVDSTPGVGSVFHFITRFTIQPPDAPRPEGKETDTGSEATSRPLRILLAEDNTINQKLAQRIVEKAGHSLSIVDNGSEALRLLEHEHFDLILMDVMMPIMDGVEATKAIRQREKVHNTHTPIIAMTAHAMTGDREKFIQAGMDDYISKPIKAAQLLELINKTVQGNT